MSTEIIPNSEFRIPHSQSSEFRVPNSVFSDDIRYAPVMSAVVSGQNDYFMQSGASVRVRDKKNGYFRFVINSAEDIEKLTEGLDDILHRIIAIDAGYEAVWRELFPEAVYKQFRLTVVTRQKLRPHKGRSLPNDMRIVTMDKSWDEFVIKLCEDEEFTADMLRSQLRNNLSLGLLWRGERAGFISTHLNGELGPLWISPIFRGRGLGTTLMREYLKIYFEKNPIVFGLSAPENRASAKIMKSLGFQELDKNILHITRGGCKKCGESG